ncbi:MAG: NAD(P)H-dependent oxidoreductase subunit E, partial [Cyanobacteria bacterium]|nr:NAD(P)H-dependent oxidoreductase subunit E [Cyanobacteriota bacterium]
MSGLRCCASAGCLARGSGALMEALNTAISRGELGDQIQLRPVGCLGPCSQGPLLALDPDGDLYAGVDPQDAETLVAALARRLHQSSDQATPLEWAPARGQRLDLRAPFFQRQRRIVMEHCGLIDPTDLEQAIAMGAYGQLERVLQGWSPEQVVTELQRSGLRGRGGAGYPTGLKWATVARMPGARKVVVCNADEGDPGAFMDRAVLEGDPHRVLEGMAIAAYAVGAEHGFIYIRAEYELAIERLRLAIGQAVVRGRLGAALFGTGFGF